MASRRLAPLNPLGVRDRLEEEFYKLSGDVKRLAPDGRKSPHMVLEPREGAKTQAQEELQVE